MAERRMFTQKVTEADNFTTLPPTTQCLYFHLCMNADDDGFSNKIRQAMFNAHADQNDFEMLVNKRFIIPFDSGVIVIKHWRMHNYIRNDRYHETSYVEEKSQLLLKENGVYTESVNKVDTIGIPNGYQMDTEVRLGKDRLGKDRLNNNMSNKELDELRLRFEQLAKNYRSVHDNPNGKSKARDKYIKWCTTGCKVDGKNVKFTPEQIENAFGHYVQEHINKEERGEWIEPYKNINTIMNNIMDWMEE